MHARSRFRAATPAPESTQSLLAEAYGLQWSVPAAARVPDVRDEADYVHHVADLFADGDDAAMPRGPTVRLLDIGAGAGCLRAFVAASEYGWRLVATNRDQGAHRWGRQIVRINRAVAGLIEGRHQPDATACLAAVTTPGERFAACFYDPGVERDPAGEVEWIGRLIAESAARPALCGWFTAVVATGAAVTPLRDAAGRAGAADVRDAVMAAGTPGRVLLAWRYPRPLA